MKSLEKLQKKISKNKLVKRTLQLFFIVACIGVAGLGFFVVQGKLLVVKHDAENSPVQEVTDIPTESVVINQFPIGVNPKQKMIVENPAVDSFFNEHVSVKSDSENVHASWFGKVMGKLALMNWYQNLASLSSRILVIESGERKEQVASHFAKILGWNDDQKNIFINDITASSPALVEGKFSPGTYTVARGAEPAVVAEVVRNRFAEEVLARYGTEIESVIPLQDTLIIASLLEREAYDFEDMRLISGVIWNRLFVDMRLQIDATLQYAKGTKSNQTWWPKVLPADKYIASVYNTYKNLGLPPAPIANPSVDAILAALNPKQTDCMYYFHDARAEFHCSITYEEHVKMLKQYYGQGK